MSDRSSPLLKAYWQDIRHCEPISRDEEIELVRRARDGDTEAMGHLVAANLRFVVAVAREFRGTGQPLHELISDGNLGLMEAARRFDEHRGFKFITYAVWWIRQSIRKSLAERRRTVVAPSNRVADLKQVERAQFDLGQTLGRTPSLFEIADRVGYSPQRVQRALGVSASEVHLDRSLYAGDESTPVSSLFESAGAATEAEAEERDAAETVQRCLQCLESREREIIRRYYGFDGCEPMTLEQIGVLFGLTRERIRQLRDRGLTKLRDEFGEVLFELSHN